MRISHSVSRCLCFVIRDIVAASEAGGDWHKCGSTVERRRRGVEVGSLPRIFLGCFATGGSLAPRFVSPTVVALVMSRRSSPKFRVFVDYQGYTTSADRGHHVAY